MKKFLVVSVMCAIFAYVSAGQGICGDTGEKAKPAQSAGQETQNISGKVVETMDSGSYTYVQLEKADGKKLWLAVPKMKLKKGQDASFLPGGTMVNFQSKTLNRKFDEIIFSAGPAREQKAPEGMKSSGSKGNVVTTAEPVKVEKASGENAYTIAEVYEKSTELNQKKVVVRAKVVKASMGIMDKNWLHIQDGTGDTAKGTKDLVVTTGDSAAAGDVVTVSGTLSKDKDFGAGYKYSVIIENAAVTK